MKAPAKRSLDEYEKKLVDQSKKLEAYTHRELTNLARQLRSRRERILRMIRGRKHEARKLGELNPDTGAHEKKAELIAAIDRVNAALEASTHANRGVKNAGKTKPAAKPKSASKAKDSGKKTAEADKAAKPAKKSSAAAEKKPAAPKSKSE